MSREQKYTAVVLKKQPFGESDEIITLYSKEAGKIRCLAKSVKSSKSKMQQRLQALFLLNITLSLGKLPKIISAEVVEVYYRLRENLAAVKAAYYASELVSKISPDEQKNEKLYKSLTDFLEFLNFEQNEEKLGLGLVKFKTDVLEASGFSIVYPQSSFGSLFFSPQRGGFSESAGGREVSAGVLREFLNIKSVEYKHLKLATSQKELTELSELLSQFLEFYMERQIKSEKFLKQSM